MQPPLRLCCLGVVGGQRAASPGGRMDGSPSRLPESATPGRRQKLGKARQPPPRKPRGPTWRFLASVVTRLGHQCVTGRLRSTCGLHTSARGDICA